MKLALSTLIAISILAATGSNSATAQNYPTKPIRFIVPFAPGGAADFTTRGLAQKLAQRRVGSA